MSPHGKFRSHFPNNRTICNNQPSLILDLSRALLYLLYLLYLFDSKVFYFVVWLVLLHVCICQIRFSVMDPNNSWKSISSVKVSQTGKKSYQTISLSPVCKSQIQQVEILLKQEYEKKRLKLAIRPILLKLTVDKLNRYNYGQEHLYFVSSVLRLMHLNCFQIKRYMYSMCFKENFLHNLRTKRGKSSQIIALLIYKTILILHQRFTDLLNESVAEILNPVLEARLRFLNMLKMFSHYLEHSYRLENNFKNDDCCGLSQQLNNVKCLHRADYIKLTEPVSDYNTNCVCIRFNHFKFVTPPRIPLLSWRSFSFIKFMKQQKQSIKLKTGIIPTKNVDKLDDGELRALKILSVDSKNLSIERVNRFLQDLNLLTSIVIDPISHLNQIDELKSRLVEELFFPGLTCDNNIEDFENYLFVYWFRHYHYQMDFETFKNFENIVNLINSQISNSFGNNTPSLRFPEFYKFLLSNKVEFSLDIIGTTYLTPINLNDTEKKHICDFYKRIFLNNLIHNHVLEDEINGLIVSQLQVLKQDIKLILKKTITHYLHMSYNSILAKNQEFHVFLQNNISNSMVAKTIEAKFFTNMIEESYKPTSIDFQTSKMIELHKEFHDVTSYYYAVYCPILNWIYRDISSQC